MEDTKILRRALQLAKKGKGWTNPNPMVGAVIIKNGKIIGEGYHKKAGLPHAEAEAIRNAREDVKDATLYVTLEPCCIFGKTPPCAKLLIKSGIKRVICAIKDPNPKVHGKGITQLRKAGIEVILGMLEDEARLLNESFFTFHEKKRPFIALKFASSLDGKIATCRRESKWITNEKARKFARNLRSNYQAVVIGINTVLSDDPDLGARTKKKKDPLRIIMDSKLKIPLNSNILRDNNVLIATTIHADKEKKQELTKRNIPLLIFNAKKIPLKKFLNELVKKEIISIFVEGGSQILGNFVDEKLADKIYAFSSPILIGGEKALGAIGGKGANRVSDALVLKNVNRKTFGDNLLTTGYISSPT